MALSCVMSDINELLVENSIFLYPRIRPPLSEWSPSEYCHNVWYGKTNMPWLSDGEKSLMTRSAISIEYRRVTDRRISFDIVPHSIAR